MREQLRDALQLFVVPCLAACLPWSLGFRLLARVAQAQWTFPRETENALAAARSLGPIPDEAQWRTRHRLLRLVDHADLYLSLLRSDRWLARHVTVEGRWPDRGPYLAAFFHWGAGMWALRHLRHCGQSATFLSIYFDRLIYRAIPVRYWYARLRAWETGRAAGSPLIYTGNAPAEMRRLYRQGKNVTAAIDVPLAQTRSRLPAKLFGREAMLPSGVIRIALRMNIPIVVFSVALDYETGHRHLRITPPLGVAGEAELAQEFARQLEELVASDSPGWQMWVQLQQFFPA